MNPEIPKLITHSNMEPLLDAISAAPEFQCGYQGRHNPHAWYRAKVWLEFPVGELTDGWLKRLALVGSQTPTVLPIEPSDRFNAQGLEGKARIERDLFGALMALRGTLAPYRGQIRIQS